MQTCLDKRVEGACTACDASPESVRASLRGHTPDSYAARLGGRDGGGGLIEALIVNVLSGVRADWADALRLLVEAFAARGAEVSVAEPEAGYGGRGGVRTLLSHGQGREASAVEDAAEFYLRARGRGGGTAACLNHDDGSAACVDEVSGSGPYLACCAVTYEPDGLLGVAVWGDERAAFEDLSLLRSYCHLMAYAFRGRRRVAATAPEPAGDASSLLEGYVAGRSGVMTRLHREVRALAPGDFPVLIQGETGVGKEHLARLLHTLSGRAAGPFVAVNCAALPTELMEAEMFGIGRGVASGVQAREGYFRLAQGGTLFLDEIGELHPGLQAKLLRTLQDKEVRQLGGATFKADARVLSATNADLRRRMDEGSFRPDLYYRICGFELRVPPLRERRDDLRPLVQHFLRRCSAEAGKTLEGVTHDALGLLQRYDWPGNIRELEHEIRRLVYLCPEGRLIDSDSLSARILEGAEGAGARDEADACPLSLAGATARMERRLITRALRLSLGNRTKAAALLGITRNGLAIKMQRLMITPAPAARGW